MKKEDIEFLKELQNELKTQDTDGQSNPRFWMVASKTNVPHPEGDKVMIYNPSHNESYTLEEYISYVEENLDEQYLPNWNTIDKNDVRAIIDFVDYALGEFVSSSTYNEEYLTMDNTFFLTKRAAKKHIELNGYHYRDPHPYAMTAWRSPEFERFLNIFTEMNIDDIKVE